MSNNYHDSKGIRHASQHDAEAANGRYLREERYARQRTSEAEEEAAEEACRQRKAMEQMARQAEIQSLEEECHNHEMRQLTERSLINQERHNNFQRDLLYLEKENALDRKSYILKRTIEESDQPKPPPLPSLPQTVQRHLETLYPIYEDQFQKLRELLQTQTQCLAKLAELKKRKWDLEKEKQNASIGLAGVVCLGVAFMSSFGSLVKYSESHEFDVDLLYFGGSAAAVGIVILIVEFSRRACVIRRCGGNPKQLLSVCTNEKGGKEAEMPSLRNKVASLQKSICESMSSGCEGVVLKEVANSFFTPKWYRDGFLTRVDDFQSQFPKSVRISLSEVTLDDIRVPYSKFLGVDFLHVVRQEILSQCTKLCELPSDDSRQKTVADH